MSDLRADRERAYWYHWRRSLRENPREGLPAFLDALEAIDREAMATWRYKAGGVIYEAADVTIYAPGSGELTEERAAQLAAAIREQTREAADLLQQPAAPVRPATRRRAAPKGGAT